MRAHTAAGENGGGAGLPAVAVMGPDETVGQTVEAIEDIVVPAASEPKPSRISLSPPRLSPSHRGASEPAAAAEAAAAPAEGRAEGGADLGVPLVGDDERTDTVLLKFLRMWEFKVKEAIAMLKSAVLWHKCFGIDELLGTDLGLPR